MGEFPSLGIPKNGQKIHPSLCPLTGGGEKGAPALTEQEWGLQHTSPDLLTSFSGGPSPLVHPDEASAPFFSTRMAEAGKEQGRNG